MMKQFLIFLSVLVCLSIHAIGQNITADLFQQPVNTGVNMTLAINTSSFDQYEGGQIGAFFDLNGDGSLQCVGVQTITSGFFGLALWGNDSFTTEADGLSTGAIPQFAILFEGNVIPFNESPEFTGFETNGIFFVTDTDLPNHDLYPIEDPYFLNYLQNNYPDIIVNDSLNINATAGIDTLDLPFMSYFTNIDPVQFFNDLTYLSCWGQDLTNLPELPDGLKVLLCASNELTSLPELPAGLTWLSCGLNQLTNLPDLPDELVILSCNQNNLTSLPVLPQNLSTITFFENPLECVSNYLPQFQELNAYPLCGQSSSFCEPNQWLLPFEGNTGSNMTLLLQESFVTSLNIQTNNAYIVATTEIGLVVGSSYLNNSQTSLAVWGDDAFTPEIVDGATDGQLINLHLIDSNLLYDINTSFNYVTNDLDVISNEVSAELICTAENLGCTDESACNYNAEAIIEDGSCTYSETYFDCNGNCINDSDADGICDELEVPGCTNPNASNYNNIATEDDGTCIILGCTDQEACNYDDEANTDNESCFYAETYFDCNGNCINDSDTDGICDELEIPGCTNPNASNYNSNATDDDGTCIILGCTDQEACNWNVEANTDDESCIYAETYYNCDGSCINDFDLDGECDEVDYDDDIGINEVETESAQLIKMIDVLGREYKEHKIGMLLFYIYENGKVEKRVIH